MHYQDHIWLGTVEAWLDPALNTKVVKLEWITIENCKGKAYYFPEVLPQ